jgi:hypothetical protein
MSAFDRQAGSRFAGGQVPTYASDATLSVLDDLVIQVVDRCGFQVMADIAYQYPAPLYGWFLATAASALGEISTLPPGLRCADLAALGWGPKQAVD